MSFLQAKYDELNAKFTKTENSNINIANIAESKADLNSSASKVISNNLNPFQIPLNAPKLTVLREPLKLSQFQDYKIKSEPLIVSNLQISNSSGGFIKSSQTQETKENIVRNLKEVSTVINNQKKLVYSFTNLLSSEQKNKLYDELKYNSTLHSLDLTSCKIGLEGARAIALALKINLTLTTLNLDSNMLGFSGAEVLANTLISNCVLKKLNLSKNNIGDAGAIALANALITNSKLINLCLITNNIGATGAQAFAVLFKINKTIKKLNLLDNKFDTTSKNILKEGIKSGNNTSIKLSI